ncbi:polymorphic toxin-type HINT domain-containing protein [Thalassoglobus sp. JC818]|uniref:polymorphic toxin-type HINT domain-containing protein n=1 Tax=Thalassoglobus sp. JC818 TaxID=3232136 RepID=UPI0034595ABF
MSVRHWNRFILLGIVASLAGLNSRGSLSAEEVATDAASEQTERDPFLSEFLQSHPDHPLNRWVSGDVWNGNDWMPFHRVVEQDDRWNRLYRYREERAKLEDNFRDQLFLADGCREHGLYAEERAHLVRTLLIDYSFHEAHERLGHIHRNGTWISPEQVRRMANEAARTEENLAEWEKEIDRLSRLISHCAPGSKAEKKWIAELNTIRTPDAIPALERNFASKGQREAKIFQDWLGTIDSYRACEALARQAVLSDSAKFRTQAAKLLRDRRPETYVPYLLQGMTSTTTRYQFDDPDFGTTTAFNPINTIYRVVSVDSSDTTITTTREVRVSNGALPIPALPRRPARLPRGLVGWNLWGEWFQRDEVPVIFDLTEANVGSTILMNYGQAAIETGQDVRDARIMRTLASATQIEVARQWETSQDCYDWWNVHQEVQLADGKLQLNDNYNDGTWYVDNRRGEALRVDQVDTIRAGSCLVPGTLVETERGSIPIEEIAVGDQVLSQDIETGEITFKPVLHCSLVEDTETIEIVTSHDIIRCSLGHPFWVSGLGWRLAKELEPGMSFVTVSGETREITSITPAENAPVYNLIVADFSTYFVGEDLILTHGLGERRPTDMVYPGVMRKFE